jgi:hypothetical protein
MMNGDHDDPVYKPLSRLLEIPPLGLRFLRLRFLIAAVVVWNVAFLLIGRLGGSMFPDYSPPVLGAQGLVCLAFAACCLAVLFVPSIEELVLSKPEGRRALRRDLVFLAALLLLLGVVSLLNFFGVDPSN